MQMVPVKKLLRQLTRSALLTYAILIVGASASGCAFTNVDVQMPTGSTSGYTGGQNRPLAVAAVVDQRQSKDRIGMQKNNMGSDTASAIPDQKVETWLAARLADELQSAGFQIARDGANPKAAVLQAHLLKLFIEPVVQWTTVDLETDFSVKLRVTRPDGLEAERQYFVKGLGQAMMSASGAYSASLKNATDTLMKRIVADVINLLNKFPES